MLRFFVTVRSELLLLVFEVTVTVRSIFLVSLLSIYFLLCLVEWSLMMFFFSKFSVCGRKFLLKLLDRSLR